jgi:hypothetical protein
LTIIDCRKFSYIPKSAALRFAPSDRVSEGSRIRAGEEADAGDIALKPRGKKLIASQQELRKFWIISESPVGPFIATIRTDVPANFLRLEWRVRHGRVWPKIQIKLNGRAPQRNTYTHSVTNLAAETARYGNAKLPIRLQDENIKFRPKITDFYRLSFEIFALANFERFANSIRFTGYYQ